MTTFINKENLFQKTSFGSNLLAVIQKKVEIR